MQANNPETTMNAPDQLTQLRTGYEAEIERMQKSLQFNHRISRQKTLADAARTVVEGLRELGFDRAGVWLKDAGMDSLCELWGTDDNGVPSKGKDGIAQDVSVPPDHGYHIQIGKSVLMEKLGVEEPYVFLEKDQDEDRFESIWGYPPPYPGFYRRDERGDNICFGVTTDNDRVIVIAVDNYVTKRPIDEASAKLLSLVAGGIAQVLTNVALRESLERSEVRSRAILDAIPDLMFRLSRDGVYLDYKADNEDELYVPGKSLIGNNVRDILPPELAELTVQRTQETLDSGEPQIHEYQLSVPKGVRDYEARLVVSGDDEVLAIVRDVTDQKLAWEKEKEYVHSLTFLQRTAMGFVELPSEDDIYQFIGEKLKELLPDSVVTIATFDKASRYFTVRAVLGLGKVVKTVTGLLGESPVGISVKAVDEVERGLADGKLVRLPDDFHLLSGGKVSDRAARTIRRILNLGPGYTMGFIRDGELFGNAICFLKKGVTLENWDVVRIFVNQASVALQRRQAEEQIKASLAEKEVLLKEIHHRVKNNLQIISSLFNLQSDHVESEQSLKTLRASQSRIRSMALIHEKLYQSEDLARVDFAEYTRDLANHLFRMYEAGAYGISLEINIDNVLLNIDKAIPCGLIINELVSNSLKYAFPTGGIRNKHSEHRGKISIDLHRNNNSKFTLVVSDNGIGFPADLNFRETESLGLQLVETLTDQLEGYVELDRESGTTFRITFEDTQ